MSARVKSDGPEEDLDVEFSNEDEADIVEDSRPVKNACKQIR
jgi:hypothetical protein